MARYETLRLTPRPEMTHPDYFAAVAAAAAELRAAQPWMLVTCANEPWLVARDRTLLMLVVTALVNLWRRPRRWWRDRLQMAYEFRQSKGNRNT